ncbi:ankyrin repeat domain-containing protein 2a [Artemisia annua]|uniref:Ankyrin repeat domain-containing protein 2a n=1 Tax=Artemisia annua TaxID=35608 RepID=A0A2U1NV21_ARTAN|nr:ankyrin repeat domain-containing protein 2a [Artemisia annua]
MGAEANRTEQNPIATDSEHVDSLLEAARYNDLDDVKSLAAIGVSLDSKDAEGRTALHMASANGNVDIVNYLISNKVDVNACNVEDNTPLHWACLNGHIEVVKILIIAGADVSRLNKHEQTPVDEAAIGGKMNVIDAINTAVAEVELTRASTGNSSPEAPDSGPSSPTSGEGRPQRRFDPAADIHHRPWVVEILIQLQQRHMLKATQILEVAYLKANLKLPKEKLELEKTFLSLLKSI